jgi:hypothetical protein
MKKSYILILVVILLLAAAFYFYKSGGEAPESETLQVNPEVQASAARVLLLLNQIKSLRIDPAIFTSAEYQTLYDNTVVIPPLPVGRANPFAPLPGVQSNSSAPRTTGTRR